MSIYQTKTNSFMLELYSGYHAFTSNYRPVDTFNIALYTSTANLDATTTAYTTSNEVSGTGYIAGGQALTIVPPAITGVTTGGVVYLNFLNAIWTPANFSAAGALIYNASQGNRSVAVLAFGNSITATTIFTVVFPSNGQNTSLIRSM